MAFMIDFSQENWPMVNRAQADEHNTGCSKRSSNEAAGKSQPEAYPPGYVEDCDEPRTKLGAFFSSLLGFSFDTFDIKSNLDLVADDEPTAI